MTKVFALLEQLESTSGTNAKKAFLKANSNNSDLQKILDLTYNYKYRYYVKKYETPILSRCRITQASDVNWAIFQCMVQDLNSRNVTGNAAINQVESFLKQCSDQEVKWYDRVLQRDLRCGINVSTIKESGIDVPEFEVQLAKDGKTCKKLRSIVESGCFLSKKLDGYRCVAVIVNGEVTLYSRNGTIYENFPKVAEQLKELSSVSLNNKDIVFDGEIMSDNFNNMQQSAFASVRGTTVGDMKYNIFDCIDYQEWSTDKFKETAHDRYTKLSSLINGAKSKTPEKYNLLEVVDHIGCSSLDDAYEFERKCIAAGFEGAMINPNIPYYRGKVSNKMLKLKTMQSQDCTITGFIEGNGKYKQTLGALLVKQENGQTCEVGSGFKDEERDYIWKNQSNITDRIIEVKYQELTPDGIMRFPIFLRWRDSGQNTEKK